MANNEFSQNFSAPQALEEILFGKRVADLRAIAQAFEVKGISRLAKAELCATLASVIPAREDLIKQQILSCPPSSFPLLRKAAENTCLQLPADADFSACAPLEDLGLLQHVPCECGMCLVVPAEIKPVYLAAIPAPAFSADAELTVQMHRYATAAASLYGIVPLEELSQIFSQQNARKSTAEEWSAFLDSTDEPAYCRWETYLVHSELRADDFKPAQSVRKQAAGKARYIPAKNEFLKYTDPGYYPQNLQTAKLERYLKDKLRKTSNGKYTAASLLHEIHHRIIHNANTQMMLDALLDAGITFDGQPDAQKAMEYIVDVHNNTRSWFNNGHTPRELAAHRKRLSSLQEYFTGAEKVQKVGRNEPCPCGSGKKYKKCCGM